MHATHFHPYEPSVSTNILETFRKMGWVPPSEDPKILEKWKYFQECAWRKENKNAG